jgi:hypothetical protein
MAKMRSFACMLGILARQLPHEYPSQWGKLIQNHTVWMYSIIMRVRVYQAWRDGKAIDARMRSLTEQPCAGYLLVESQDGERFACLIDEPYGQQPRKELLPRLWAPVLVKISSGEVILRGVQKDHGRLCHQEWRCYVTSSQH